MMETLDWQEYRLSRLMLGTVQFGLPYGVANRTGQPSYAEVCAIVAAAIEGGVTCFDTAAAYGTSEETLGRVLRELKATERVVVVTKVRALTPAELADGRLAAQAIRQSVETSRQRLNTDTLPLVLFHREADGVYLDELLALRDRGWLRHAGVSCDNRPGPAAEFAADRRVSALQIPGSLLDRRHQLSGLFGKAESCDMALFVRSVYLQGLLLMPQEAVPAHLHPVLPVRRQLAAVAAVAGMELSELALRYMLSQPGVTSLVVGVETVAQMQANLRLFDGGPLPPDTLAAVDTIDTDLPEACITPSMWAAGRIMSRF